ncbi:TerB family tellurite resistance protein [Tenacibaculum sp. M341]|uniref:TerB family tellurite resistance protein n=1 Tax=Tenacibaculum sp. M341 TaxID=2530339 RepID=UPI001049508D|nr:TerB family tellurite resistance protein [Tenacibaculum sp. M341]TCI93699.1 TerB family tellurite resistance protein [Tenacibaculum sp. M341]
MSILDLFESNEHRNGIAHFAAIVHIATLDVLMDEHEEHVINAFATALNINNEEYKDIMHNHSKYALETVHNTTKRLYILYDLFKSISSNKEINNLEIEAVIIYAVELGYSVKKAQEIIEKSIDLFKEEISFNNYQNIIEN